MRYLQKSLVVLFFIFNSHVSLGEDSQSSSVVTDSSNEDIFQQVVNDYREYVSKIPAPVRDEVVEYRKSIAKINKEKRELYRKLSQDAQDYLKQEQEFKKKLPMNKRNLINNKNVSDETKDETKETDTKKE